MPSYKLRLLAVGSGLIFACSSSIASRPVAYASTSDHVLLAQAEPDPGELPGPGAGGSGEPEPISGEPGGITPPDGGGGVEPPGITPPDLSSDGGGGAASQYSLPPSSQLNTQISSAGNGGGNGSIQLLQPVGSMTQVTGVGFQAFYNYFNGIWPWIMSVAVGIAILNGVIGGFMVMIAGDDTGMRSSGFEKLQYSTLGLIIIALAGTILRIINPTFYQ